MQTTLVLCQQSKQRQSMFLCQSNLNKLEFDSFNYFIANFQKLEQQNLELLNQNQFNRLLKVVKIIKVQLQRMSCWIKKIQSYQIQLQKTIKNTKLLDKINKIFLKREQYDYQLKNIMTDMINRTQNNQYSQGHKKILSVLQTIQTQIENLSQKKDFCCTTSFYLHQIIEQVQNDYYEFKNFELPLRQDHMYTLKKTICGLLNWMGGYIFIGIKQLDNLKMVVRGVHLNKKEKERFINDMKKITLSIHPTIYISKRYFVDFIPIVNTNKQIYVIKITVKPGQRSSLYSIKMNEYNQIQYWKRNGPQVIKICNYELQKQIIRRYETPLSSPIQHTCISSQIFGKSNQIFYSEMNSNQCKIKKTNKMNFIQKTNGSRSNQKKNPILVTSDISSLQQIQQFDGGLLKNTNLLFDLTKQQ